MFLAAVLSCGYASAQEKALSLDECISLAKEKNNSISAAHRQAEAAEFSCKSMRANFLPSFSVSGGALWSSADGSMSIPGGMLPVLGMDGNPTGSSAYFPGMDLDYSIDWIYGGSVSVTQPLYMGGKIIAGYKMTRLGREIADLNVRLKEDEVILGTATAYANVIRAEELHKVAESYNDLLAELLRTVRKASESGLGDRNDVLKVQVKVNESELSLRKAENAVRLAKMNLCHYIGYPLRSEISVTDALPSSDIGAPDGLDDISGRPEYQMLEKKSEAAFHQVRVTRAEALPQAGLFAGYGYAHGLNINDEPFLHKAGFSAGVKVSIPIFHFGEHYYKIRAQKATYEQTLAEQNDACDMMILEMNKAANEMDEAEYETALASGSIESAEENLRVSRSRYDAGAETLANLLEAQAAWQQAYQTGVEAEVNEFLTWLSWLKASGRLSSSMQSGR